MTSAILPKDQVVIARNHYLANALMLAGIQGEYIKATQLPAQINITVDGETRLLKWENRSQINLINDAENNLKSALGVAVTVTNDVMEKYFRDKPYQDKNVELRAARCIIYMFRCAFAHNPLNPSWQVNKVYREIFSVPSVGIILDTRDLNGKYLQDTGLPNWFRMYDLLNYCEKIIPSTGN